VGRVYANEEKQAHICLRAPARICFQMVYDFKEIHFFGNRLILQLPKS